MVVLPQGNAAFHVGIQAVVKGAGGVEADHTGGIDGKGDQPPGRTGLHRPQQQEDSSQNAQPHASTVGDGRPGAQPVIGVPSLLLAQPPGLGEGEVKAAVLIFHAFIHKNHLHPILMDLVYHHLLPNINIKNNEI